jgi:hypothetical protein
MIKAHSCKFFDISSNTVIRKILYPTTQSLKVFTFWLIGEGFHALQCRYSTSQRISKFAYNISHNFGIQHMKGFRRSLAQTITFLMLSLAVWTAARTGL